MARVLFVCTQNAGRSQMGQALFERAAKGRHQARSAGTRPATEVHPVVVEAMLEIGMDLSERRPQALTRDLAARADILVTMGCGDEVPRLRGKGYIDWDLPDPSVMPLDDVRRLREQIDTRTQALVRNLNPPR